MKVIITGACAVSARNVLRSLKMSKCFKDTTFVGWDTCTIMYGVYSKDFERVYKVPAVSDPQYKMVIEEVLEKEKPDAVLVIPEVEVLYWSEHPFNIPHLVPPASFCELAISKRKLFEVLKDTGLVPESKDMRREDILNETYKMPLAFPVWIRDDSAGTASGKGSFLAHNRDELCAWVNINIGIDIFQVSEYCPGGNYGVLCLYEKGKLLKVAIAERIEYIMAKVAASGITGNTAQGRFLNDERIKRNALQAIENVCAATNSELSGVVVVDMKVDKNGVPKVTEINIRYVAYNSCLAMADFNLAEYHLLTILGRSSELSSEQEITFPTNNRFLRDVDGLPIYITDHQRLDFGQYV